MRFARNKFVRVLCFLFCIAGSVFAAEQAAADSIDLTLARQQFQAAQEICQADGGKLWGVSLCGPVLIVDPHTRRVVANQKDGAGVLQDEQGVFTGVLPASVNISNTALQWSGTLWSQIIWPLPEDATRRNVLFAHELFHRIQNKVAVPAQGEAANDHLDTLEGRYLLQLEWRALGAALTCKSQSACHQALSDALIFRAARYQLFPSAAAEERALELNEGIAEYTGVKLGNRTSASQVDAALYDLSMLVEAKSFVRSFAYATGAPYGLLLDKFSPNWRRELQDGPSLNEMLKKSAAISLPAEIAKVAKQRAAVYNGVELRRSEEQREATRQQTLAVNRAKFVDGPVLTLPLSNMHMNIQFNPQTLQPLDKFGTVYPTLRVTADWGVLEVENGALLKSDWSTVYVVAPIEVGAPVRGDGWTLALKPEWKIVRDERRRDFQLAGPLGK